MMISVVTINFNNYSGLLDTYNSVFSQKYSNFEWIVVDGGSKDLNTKKLLEKIRRISSIKKVVVISENDHGCYDAMNKGLLHASGDYVVFMNSGDRFYNETTLLDVTQVIGPDKYSLVYGDFIESYPDNINVNRCARPFRKVYVGMPTCHQSMYFNLHDIKKYKVVYNLDYKISADYQFLCDFYFKTEKFNAKTVNKCLSIFDMTGLSFVNSELARREYISVRINHLKINRLLSYLIYSAQKISSYLRDGLISR